MKRNLFKLAVLGFLLGFQIISNKATAATVTWVGGSGDWNITTNWSTGTLPGTNDNVVINPAAAITVTYSSGTHTVNSIQSSEAFVLSGGQLTVTTTFQASNTLTLSGGTLQTATVTTTANGVSLIVNGSGTLNGVTVNGVLDVGNTYGGAGLTVIGGLVLNGTCYLGNPTNGQGGTISFAGTQSLGGNGTVVFGNDNSYYSPNLLVLANAGTTLTIGGGITVHGQNGIIGTGLGVYYYGGPANVSVINQGTISCDVSGGGITVNAQPFINQGLTQGVNGGSLNLPGGFGNTGILNVAAGSTLGFGGSWTNTGVITLTNGTVNLGGTFTLGNVGLLNRSGGSVILTGTLNNTNTTLNLSGTTNAWVLNGGTINGGSVTTLNGASLIVWNGNNELNGVTVNGVLDVGNTYGGAGLTVIGGLVLNGTCYLGNPTNGQGGTISFAGTQSLGGNGTVVFGNDNSYYSPNLLVLANAGTTLTIGGGITVHGQNGIIGTGLGVYYYGGPANVSVINQGTISCDVSGGGITVNAQPFINQGLTQGVNGGSLNLPGGFGNTGILNVAAGSTLGFGGSWTNTGVITLTNGTVNLGGTFTLGNVGLLNRSGGSVILTGTLNNTNTTLNLSGTTNAWVLNGGTINGGSVTTLNGASLIVWNGNNELNGVTVNGVLDVGNTYGGAGLTVIGGLVLNGTCYLGNPTNGQGGTISFAGTQSLGGNGTVVFGNDNSYYSPNLLVLANAGTTLTIGGGITVHGQNGIIGTGLGVYYYGGPANVSVINQGTISCDVSGGGITVNAQPFINQGLTQGVNGGSLNLPGGFGNTGILNVAAGSTLGFGGSWTNTGVITLTNGTVNLGGTFTLGNVGLLNRSGGSVILTGTLNNTNTTLNLSGTTNAWVLNGGTINGGSVTTLNGASLIVWNGNNELNGVTVNGVLDVGNTYGGAGLTVIGGLVLNGTCYLGNPTNGQGGTISFAGTQSLGGNGTVVFGNDNSYYSPNLLVLANAGTTLTIGGGITVHGQNGIIGTGLGVYYYGGPANVSVINQGTISCDVSGGGITVNAQPFINQGLTQGVNGGSLNLPGGFGNTGILNVAAGSTLGFGGSWTNTGVITLTNGTVNLGGTFTLGNVGLLNRSGGSVILTGTLNNTNTTLNLSGTTNAWVLNGGTINGGSVTTLNGASLIVWNGNNELNGVTVNGVLDVGNTYGGAGLTVIGGLVLNGTCYLGNPTNGQGGTISFAGTQSLGGNGTVVFGNDNSYYSPNLLVLANAGTTLTIGGGITVHGQNGIIGTGLGVYYYGGPANVSVINQGTISCDVSGGGITVNAQPFINQGLTQGVNGGSLNLPGGFGNTGILNVAAGSTLGFGGSWTNTGVITLTNGTVNLGGTFTLGNVGLLNRSGGSVILTGTLNNTNTTLNLSGTTNAWVLNGGTINGGSVTTLNGASLIVWNGNNELNGVTVNGVLDVGNTYGGAGLTVIGGLVLNGTCYLGNPTNGQGGTISFAGTQSLGGNGTVVFGNDNSYYSPNLLVLANAGTTLTIGGGITVHGQNGIIGTGLGVYYYGGPANVSVINQGTISCDVSGGGITVNASSFQNSGAVYAAAGNVTIPASGFQNTGTLEAGNGGILNVPQLPLTVGDITTFSGGTINFAGSVYFNGLNSLNSEPGSTVQMTGSLLGDTKNLGQFTPLGTITFDGSGTASSPQLLEVMGADLGTSQLGFIHNFNYGTITLGNNTYVQLVNQYQNSSSTAPEALYVNSLIVPTGTTFNMNGFHVYARATQIGGTVLNGTVTQIPNSGPIGFGNPSLGDIATAGQLDQWTFFARAGQVYTVLIDPGSEIGTQPYLGYVKAQVVNSNGVALASNTNSNNGAPLLLSSVTITNDGTYSVEVQASATSPGSTGHYMVTIWQTTPNVMSLPLGQIVSGSIQTPYSLDEWQFGAVSNSQVQFHLVNVTGSGIGFDLIGPNGWEGFTNLTGNSSFITLPASGQYSVNAHSLNGDYGAVYAFQLNGVAITNLAIGSQYEGEFATSGQGQLLEFNVAASAPLQVILNNLATNNNAVVYAQLGQPPTPTSYSYSATASGPNQQLLIPVATAGTWYVLVYGDNIQNPGPYTVTVSSYSVILNSLTPNISGLNQPFTITLSGAGFDSSSSVQFIDSSNNVHQATSVSVNSFTQITVNEDAGALQPGMYSVRASLESGSSSTLTNAFQVLTYGIPNLVTSLTLPGVMGYHIPSTIYPNYGNTGGAAMAAPLLVLNGSQAGSQGALMTLDNSLVSQGLWTSAEPLGFSHSIEFLGSGRTPGLLQPGESFQKPVYYAGWQQPWNFSYPPINWNLGVIQTTDTTPIDWPSLQTSMQPSSIPADAWSAIFAAFTNEVGSTWGAYVSMLDNNSFYLGQLGLNVTDISKLLGFQLMQADGLCPLRSLTSSLDASAPSPGLPLTFSRFFGEPISQRYAFGTLGRGWSHNWQYSLQQGSDGTVTIVGPGGLRRVFQPNTQSEGYWAQAGDYGTLASAGGGAFTLTEKSGLVSYYAPNGTLSYIQDLNGNTITLGYTGGLLTSLTHSSGQYIQIAYNGAGLIQTITDSIGHQTTLSYDADNQHLTGARYFDGRTASYTYNTSGAPEQLHELTGVSSSCCNWRYFNYDVYGRLTNTHLATNAEELTFTYGSTNLYQPLIGNGSEIPFSGGLCTVTDGLGNPTHFYFDNNELLNKTVDAFGNAVHLSFDNNYNLISVQDPAGRSYNYTYDSEGNVISSTDPLANHTTFSYTTYSRLTSVTDAKNKPTRYAYDPYWNLYSTTYPDSSVESWSYDDFGDPQTWNNRRDHQTFYTFNDNGQVTGKYFADGSATLYSYDGRANLTNTTTYDIYLNPLVSVGMTYDASNHLTQINYPGTKYLSFAYDDNGRRTSSVDQLGHTLLYSYDDAGRLQSMTNELGNLVVDYQYDPAGRVAVKTLGSGMFTTYQFDPAGQLLNLTNALGNGAVISSFNYTYDSRGRRTAMRTLDGNWTYTYDDIGQLIYALYVAITTNVPNQNLTYVYDSVGNRTLSIENGLTNSYTANSLNQYFSVGQTNYTFDADGNLIQEASSQGTNTYVYSDENRLVSMSSAEGTWNNSYDGLGDRVGESVDGTNTQYIVDPIGLGNVVGQYDPSGNLIAHYDHAIGLVCRVDSSANWAGYTFDGIGNVQQMVSTVGVVMNSYAYRPFGSLTKALTSVPDPFQFNGQFGTIADNDGTTLMRDRYYSVTQGRFMSPDPLGFVGGFNIMTYGFNNPVTFIDPSGDLSIDFSGGGHIPISVGSQVGGSFNSSWNGIFGSGAKWTGNGWQNEVQFGGSIVDVGVTVGASWADSDTTVSYGGLPIFGRYGGIGIQVGFKNGFPVGFGLTGGVGLGIPWIPATVTFPVPPTQTGGSGSTATVGTQDPNQLIGPAGYGSGSFVVSSNLFVYRINFENSSNAAAPAQQVMITDPLSTNYDWTTFAISEVGFGNLIISVPPGLNYFATNVPYSYSGSNFVVEIQIGIQPNTGEVYANFQSIDPTTSLPPPVNIGFLPPENGTGIGMGHVTYTIHAKGGLPDGTKLSNVALISFNEQPSIATDQIDDENPAAGISTSLEAIITLDSIPPTSGVLPLPAQSQLLQVPLSWTGQDNTNGPGIASYNIYVSDNGGAWTLWQSDTTATNATFQGQPHHTYGFTSQAIDNAGLVEPQHTTADSTTLIVANPLFQFTVTPASTNLNSTATFSYTISVKNIGSLNLSNVVMSNALPAGISLDYVQYGRGSCQIEDTYLLWSLGNMNTNISASMSITADTAENGVWTNLFSVADSQGAASANASQVLYIGVYPSVYLNIAFTNNQVQLSWPSSAGNFGLQATTNLVSAPNWSPITNNSITNGSTISVTIPVAKTNQFYRLQSH